MSPDQPIPTHLAVQAAIVLLLAAIPAGAAIMGVPAGPDPVLTPADGYLMVTGADLPGTSPDGAVGFGDATLTGCSPPVPPPGSPSDPCGQVFYIEVGDDPSSLTVGIYDPGLAELTAPQGPQLDISYDSDAALGEMHYDLRDPTGALQASLTFGADTQGAGGSNAALVPLADIPNPARGVWTLHAYMPDTPQLDEEVNVFGLQVDGFDVYTFYPVVGHATDGGAPPASSQGGSPLTLYPWIHGASAGLAGQPPEPVYGVAYFNFDANAAATSDPTDDPALGEPPPRVILRSPRGIVTPDCTADPAGCLRPSVDGGTVRRNFLLAPTPLQANDLGAWILEFSGIDATAGVLEPQAPPSTPDDLNALTLQVRDWDAPLPVPGGGYADFPAPPGAGERLWRIYLPALGIFGPSRPLKEWMGIQAIGDEEVGVGVTRPYTFLWEAENPAEYDLIDFQAAIHVNDSTSAVGDPDPATVMAIGDLDAFVDTDPASTCPNTQGTDPKRIVICGDLLSGETAQVFFRVNLTAPSEGTWYLLGDGDPDTGITGGGRPGMADYETPWTPGIERESMGPLLAPRVRATAGSCSASVQINDPGTHCGGSPLTLSTLGGVQNCGGVGRYQWTTTTGEICLPWTDDATFVSLPSGQCPAPTSPTTYRVEVECSTDPACRAEDTWGHAPEPPVHADSGASTVWLCAGGSTVLGVDDPGNGRFTGLSPGRDSCTELTYAWTPPAALSPGAGSCGNCPDGPGCPYPVAQPITDTTYTVTVTDPVTGCQDIDSIAARLTTDQPPLPIDCSLRLEREGADDIRLHWADTPSPTNLYEVVALEPGPGAPPCAGLLPSTWPPTLEAMDNAPVVATARPGRTSAVHSGGAATCPRLILYKVRPTWPCSGARTPFAPPDCN